MLTRGVRVDHAALNRWVVRFAPLIAAKAQLTGLAPVTHDNRTFCGKRVIAGGRLALRPVTFLAALVAAHHNPSLKSFSDRHRKPKKPHKAIITAVARKLVTIANALCKSRQKWTAATA